MPHPASTRLKKLASADPSADTAMLPVRERVARYTRVVP